MGEWVRVCAKVWLDALCCALSSRELRLSFNALSGTLEASISALSALTALDLSSNLLSGSIPSFLGTMVTLKELNLCNNSFTGPDGGLKGVPASITSRTDMYVLACLRAVAACTVSEHVVS